MPRRRILIRALVALIAYVVVTFLVGNWIESHYRFTMIKAFHTLGKNGLADTPRLQKDFERYPEFNPHSTVLEFMPPLGWFFQHRMNHIRDGMLFASRNIALPEQQRFSDADECQKYDFDPSKKTDVEVAGQIGDFLLGFHLKDETPSPP